MNRTAALITACALALPAVALAQGASAVVAAGTTASGERVGVEAVEIRARVVELDTANRIATLRGPRGNIVTVHVPAEAKGFDRIRAGDTVMLKYAMALVSKIEPAAKSDGIRERIESSAASTTPAGSAPGVAAVRTVEVLATVTDLDRKARTATLRGVHRTVKVAVPADVDMAKIKQGDEVHAVFREAIVLAVEPVAAPAPAQKKG
jgi:Cu/Ag efflux protein CusF